MKVRCRDFLYLAKSKNPREGRPSLPKGKSSLAPCGSQKVNVAKINNCLCRWHQEVDSEN